MKAFIAALVALVVITIGADVALDHAGFSSGEVFKTDSVRLSD